MAQEVARLQQREAATQPAVRMPKNESSKYVCGLGLEGVFGGICEWVEGVEINNRVWKITDPDGSTRNVNAGSVSGWIKNIAAENGPFF